MSYGSVTPAGIRKRIRVPTGASSSQIWPPWASTIAREADAGVPRYLIISAGGAEDPPDGDDRLSIYLRAKADADAAVQSSDLEWTILRPGPLTDDPGAGRVRVDPTPGQGTVPRDDVAAALARLLHDERAAHRVLYVNGGDRPLDHALDAVLSG